MATTETGGGASVGRDVGAGRDFTGRDHTTVDGVSNHIDIGFPDLHTPRRPLTDYSDSELLQKSTKEISDIKIALLGGDPYNPGRLGLLAEVEQIARKQLLADTERARLLSSQSNYQKAIEQLTSKLDGAMVITWVTLSCIGGIFLWIFWHSLI